ASEHQYQRPSPLVGFSVVDSSSLPDHEAGRVDAFKRYVTLFVAPHHVIAINIHGTPEIHLGYVGWPGIARVQRIEDFQPAQVNRVLEWKRTCRRFEIAGETIEGYEHDVGILSPEILERCAKGIDVTGITLFR